MFIYDYIYKLCSNIKNVKNKLFNNIELNLKLICIFSYQNEKYHIIAILINENKGSRLH